MIPLDLAALAAVVGGRLGPDVDGGTVVRSVMTDTRVPGGPDPVFVALPTASADGHDHLGAAAAAGAVAVLVSEDGPRPGASDAPPRIVVPDTWRALAALAAHVRSAVAPRTIGITGSYGKTTTKDLLAAAVRTAHRTVASRASHNNELGVPLTLLALETDTAVLVAEIGVRRAGDMDAAVGIVRPDVAVVTAVGPVHLETLGDLDGVAREKGRLVAGLRPGGTAVLNGDDPRVAAMRRPDVDVLLVGVEGGAATGVDVRAEAVRDAGGGRVAAVVRTPWGTTEVAPPLPGRHHLTNALLALAAACAVGAAPDAAAAAIATAPTSASRSALRTAGGVRVLDDAYNASPPTVLAALATLRALDVAGRRWAVLGTMAELGPEAERLHREVGAACGALDRLVAVGTGGPALADGARGAGLAAGAIDVVPDAGAALDLLRTGVAPGDAVLVKASRVVGLDRVAAGLLDLLGGSEVAA